MSILFSSLPVRSVLLPNRIAVSPMCTYSAENGFANDWHLVHLGSRAVGKAGLILSEAVAVTPQGRITPDDLGLWQDEHIKGLKRITAFIKSQGSVPGIQLAHAGRKASTSSGWKGGNFLTSQKGGWTTVAPSSIPFGEHSGIPDELDRAQIRQITAAFAAAARRALEAGFEVAEIHAAHGYLIHEFLSPLSNRRRDEYGGSFGNRIRLLLEITQAVREVWNPEYPLFVRISATDWAEGGWDPEQSVKLCGILKEKGVDLIDVSSGGLLPHARIPEDYGYQLAFASLIRRETGILTGTVGKIVNAAQAETILNHGDADLILMGRQFLRDPYFALEAAQELGETVSWPLQYERAKK